MSDSGDIKESFVEHENKVKIEATTVNFGCVKNEPNEETLDFEEDSQAKRYRITLECENIFGEPSYQRRIEEEYNNLIGFLDNDVIMENAMIKLKGIKEEDDESFNNFHCSKCNGIYKGYCCKCSTLLHVLNNNSTFLISEFESNTMPTDILEIRETSKGRGVYLLRTLPINVIFGPFEGISGIESTIGHSWKIIDNKLRNIKSGNWMKDIVCAASTSLKNLDIFQIDGNLYFQTNREITEGEELLIYYDDEELQQLDISEEWLYTPRKQEKFLTLFACTVCCLGFGTNKCLMEHKRKCCKMEQSGSMKDFVLVECHYCKMWMEKWEHEKYHVAYCLKKHHRMWSDYSEAVDRSETHVEEMKYDCGTKYDKRTYQNDIYSTPYAPRDDLQFDAKDYQCFAGANHETRLNECALWERSNNKQIQNAIETNNKSRFQKHINNHRGMKLFRCDICMMTFTRKDNLKAHIINKHTDDGSVKDYKCLECSYTTNEKSNFERHQNRHKGIKAFTCDICMAKFTEKGNLKTHIKNKHADNRSAKDYKCSECFYQTYNKTHFQAHLNKHRGIKPFTCDICMMKFTRKENLKAHIKNKHTDDGSVKDYKCLECSYQTKYKDSFLAHLNKHRCIKPFTCDICMKKFTRKAGLDRHKKEKHADNGSAKDHRGIKAFKCVICVKEFGRKDNLKRHIKNIHADDGSGKEYKCSKCLYETNRKSLLRNHLNKHRDMKLFRCDICMMTFTRKDNLKIHIRNKHTDDGSVKEYKCLECSYHTNYKDSFLVHLNKHRCIKPFTCDICMKKFTRKGGLDRHKKDKHADNGSAKADKCLYQLNEHICIKLFNCDLKFAIKANLKALLGNKHTANTSGTKNVQNDTSKFQK